MTRFFYMPARQQGRTEAERIAEKIGFDRTDPDFQELVDRIRAGQSKDEIKAFIDGRKIQDVFRVGR